MTAESSPAELAGPVTSQDPAVGLQAVFARFPGPAKRAIVLPKQEAIRFGDDYQIQMGQTRSAPGAALGSSSGIRTYLIFEGP